MQMHCRNLCQFAVSCPATGQEKTGLHPDIPLRDVPQKEMGRLNMLASHRQLENLPCLCSHGSGLQTIIQGTAGPVDKTRLHHIAKLKHSIHPLVQGSICCNTWLEEHGICCCRLRRSNVGPARMMPGLQLKCKSKHCKSVG